MLKNNSQTERWKWFVVYHLPVVAYAAIIIIVSSIPYLSVPKYDFILFDKVAHFAEYAVFAFLTFRSFSHISPKIDINRAFLLSALFLCVFALFDELYQYFVPGRHTDVYDLAGDILGSLLVLIFLRLRAKKGKSSL